MKNEIKRKWHLVDLDGKILGRIAVYIAHLLMGKGKIDFARYKDCGDNIIAINSSKIKVTGNKGKNKIYYRHSGYPHGLKKEALDDVRIKNPNKIILKAVTGMLPNNKLRDLMLKRFYIYPGSKHPFEKEISIDK